MTFHSDAPWSGKETNELGHEIVLSAKGTPVCEILFSDSLGAEPNIRREARANAQLIRQAPAMYEALMTLESELKSLKKGTLSIWDFSIDKHLKELRTISERVEEAQEDGF